MAASPQPPEVDSGTENEVEPQSEETGREVDVVSASMSSKLTFGLGAEGIGGNAFLDGLAPAGGGGCCDHGGTGRGGRMRGWFVFSGREGKRPAARSAAMASLSSART